MRQRVAAKRHTRIDSRGILEDARPQSNAIERLAIPAQRHFIAGAADEKFARHLRQSLTRNLFEVVECNDVAHRAVNSPRKSVCMARFTFSAVSPRLNR